jgi:hypothetical protein
VIEPFWLLYPDSTPPHAELLALPVPPLPDPPLPEPPLEPELLVIEGEPPHPAITKTWSANAKEQRRERKSRDMPYTRHTKVRCGLHSLFCPP